MVLDGILYGSGLLVVGAIAFFLGGPLWALPWSLLAAFVLYFFRDPDRTAPAGAEIVSPADGKVVDVSKNVFDGLPVWKLSIFLSIFDVHVNRSPISGVISKVQYAPGKFLAAYRPESSAENEQNTVWIDGERFSVAFKQIAGLIARRIVFNKKAGDRLACGERVGLIKFGSRVDLFLPLELQPSVKIGDRVRAGATVLATLNRSQDSRPILNEAGRTTLSS